MHMSGICRQVELNLACFCDTLPLKPLLRFITHQLLNHQLVVPFAIYPVFSWLFVNYIDRLMACLSKRLFLIPTSFTWADLRWLFTSFVSLISFLWVTLAAVMFSDVNTFTVGRWSVAFPVTVCRSLVCQFCSVLIWWSDDPWCTGFWSSFNSWHYLDQSHYYPFPTSVGSENFVEVNGHSFSSCSADIQTNKQAARVTLPPRLVTVMKWAVPRL